LGEIITEEQLEKLVEMGFVSETKVRDWRIRKAFRTLRGAGYRAFEAIAELAEQYKLSEERVKAIVYKENHHGDT